MKTLITSVNNYKLYVDTNIDEAGKHSIKFISTFSGARDPDGEYTKFEMYLSDDALQRLKDAL